MSSQALAGALLGADAEARHSGSAHGLLTYLGGALLEFAARKDRRLFLSHLERLTLRPPPDTKAGGAAMISPLAGTYLFFALIRVVVTTPIGWIAVAVLVAIFLARLYLAADESTATPNVVGLHVDPP